MATQSTTVQIVMPSVGESITEGTVLEWLKQVGDTVAEGDAVVEISTDKVDGEVFAPAAGVLTKILAEADETVTVGQVLGEIEAGRRRRRRAAREPPEPIDEPSGEEGSGEIVDVAIPEMGDSVAEGTMLEWLVKPGDQVAKDDPLVEMSTDKVDAELPSPVAGTVVELLVEPDETVAVGTVRLPDRGRATARRAARSRPPPSRPPPSRRRASHPAPATATPTPRRWPPGWPPSTGVDIAKLERQRPARARDQGRRRGRRWQGNGASRAAAARPAGAPSPIRGPAATLVRFMDESRSIPTATSFRTLPVDDAAPPTARSSRRAGKKLSFTHLIAWAIVQRHATTCR